MTGWKPYKGNPRGPSLPQPLKGETLGQWRARYENQEEPPPPPPEDPRGHPSTAYESVPVPALDLAGPDTISVIVPIWNLPGRMLHYSLEMLCHQTRLPLEVVVVNASFDPSPAWEVADICARYAPLVRPVHVRHRQFSLSRLFNIGIRASRGEYVALIGADMFFSANFMEQVYKHKGAGVYLGAFWGELPGDYDLGDPDTLLERWDSIVPDASPPVKFSPGAMICIRREWLHMARGYDESRTPYNYCDANLTHRAKQGGLELSVIEYGPAHALHVKHDYKPELYSALIAVYPARGLPVVVNNSGWGTP